ncbi:MAG TPA: NepR family anti-sigma factor [Hyphomicrobiaceae bacterium]|nr:NepR family anti-sigma factor [Hyphomicrobiaceae bacterium]
MLKPRPRAPSATPRRSVGPAGSTTDPALPGAIGRGLKAMFDDIVAEPVPDRFRQLLEELEHRSRKE